MAGQLNFHCARASGVAPQVALALQSGQLIRNARGAGQSDGLANLSHGWRIAATLHGLPDDLQHFALPPGENVIWVRLVWQLGYHVRDASLRPTAGLSTRPRRIKF